MQLAYLKWMCSKTKRFKFIDGDIVFDDGHGKVAYDAFSPPERVVEELMKEALNTIYIEEN